MKAAGGMDKRIDSGVTEKTQEVWGGWKWQHKTDIPRHVLEDDNNNGNKADKGRTEAAY